MMTTDKIIRLLNRQVKEMYKDFSYLNLNDWQEFQMIIDSAKRKGIVFRFCESFPDEEINSLNYLPTLELEKRIAHTDIEKKLSVKLQKYEHASLLRSYEKELQLKLLLPSAFSFYCGENIFIKISNHTIGFKKSNDFMIDYFVKLLT